MKKVIFILAFMLMGTYANAKTVENPIIDNTKTELVKSNTDLKVDKINNSIKFNITLEKEVTDKWIRRRTCYYRNGEKIGCTAWEYYEVLDEVQL